MKIDISNFENCKVLVVGDFMIDEYVWGDVERISPEAPVPVVTVRDQEYTLGGAGNVVNNLYDLGAIVSVAGIAGTGENGKLLVNLLDRLDVDTRGIVRISGRLTTRKTRIIASHQHVLRVDRETKMEISGFAFDTLIKALETEIPKADIVIISDYGKGVVIPAVLSRIIELAWQYNKPTIADPKGKDFSKYFGVTLLTPNKKEAALASGIDIENESTLYAAAAKILESSGIENLLITCGKEGMVLFERSKKPYAIKAEARHVFDVSGAGDTVVAVMGLAMATGLSLKDAAVVANAAAGIVVGKVGTATVSQRELEESLNPPERVTEKVKYLDDLVQIVRNLKRKGRRIVLTNGCFDFIHTGHIRLLSSSKQLGDILIVAINDDKSVTKLKGPGRPILNARERAGILSALDSTDYVTIFKDDELLDLIQAIKPDILTKGSNYTFEEVYGREVVEQNGGEVALIPITEDISSTKLINSIKDQH